MKRLLSGLLSGLCATAPMTLVMVLLHRLLPGGEQYPLPPYEIAQRASEDADMDAQERIELALISHFAVGGGAGAVYGLLTKALPPQGALSDPISGTVYGLIVWAANYLGLLPATGLYRAPGYEPPRRHVMMIVAHLVWGSILGGLFQQLAPQQEEAPGRRPYPAAERRPLQNRRQSLVSEERYSY